MFIISGTAYDVLSSRGPRCHLDEASEYRMKTDAAESLVLGQCEQDLSTSSRQTLRDSAEEPNALEFISGGASHRCHFFPWEPITAGLCTKRTQNISHSFNFKHVVC